MRKPDPIAKNSTSTNNYNGATKLRKGLWSPEEDERLMAYMVSNGQGCWSDVARNAGLQRCGKSCRLRWINYLRPDLKRGAFSPQEEELIVHLHSILGNRWSQIAARLPGRTDNEIKNFWNSTIKKRLKNSSSTNLIESDPDLQMTSNQHDIITMCMDLSPSSSSITNRYDLLPLPDMVGLENTYFHAPTFLNQACSLDDGFYENHGMMMMGAGEIVGGGGCDHLILPSLESVSLEENMSSKANGDNVVGGGGYWEGEEGRGGGDWDLQGLVEEASSFPFLDFQVE